MASAVSPSAEYAPGVHVELEAGDVRAVLDAAAGGRLASLVIGGVERLVTDPAQGPAPPPLPSVGWGSFLMAPWVGRLEDGRLPWEGQVHELPRNFEGHAIHGTVFDREWEVVAADSGSAELAVVLGEPWPFPGEVRQWVELRDGELVLSAEVAAADRPMPAALGWHPWFARPAEGDLRIGLAATGTINTREDLIPTGGVDALTDETDLRHRPLLGERVLDHTYVGVGEDADLVWPDLTMRISWSEDVRCVCVHTPPRGVCVEPQTAWPDAPALTELDMGLPAGRRRPGSADIAIDRTTTGLVVVEPGSPLRARTTWRWR